MTGKTHQIIGITTSLGYVAAAVPPHYSPATIGAVLAIAHFAALIPDLDQPAAKFWDSVPFGKVAGRIADPFIKHRNISHSILGVVIFAGLTWWLFSLFPDYWGIGTRGVWIAGIIAYLSHLVADMLTVEGVPLLFPWKLMIGLPPKPFEGLRIMTGKWFENFVIFPVINLVLIMIIISNWSDLRAFLFK